MHNALGQLSISMINNYFTITLSLCFLQKQACMAVRNLVARSREHCSAFLELGTEALIRHVLGHHKSCHDEAKAALRDLGCSVELKELWTGDGKGIAN